jgi:hypothetical protein
VASKCPKVRLIKFRVPAGESRGGKHPVSYPPGGPIHKERIMGDIVKRTAFYNQGQRAGKEFIEYLPFYLVEVKGAVVSQLYQPVNFQPRKVGTFGTGPKIQVDQYLQITPGMRLLMDNDRQLMKFQSCEWPIA